MDSYDKNLRRIIVGRDFGMIFDKNKIADVYRMHYEEIRRFIARKFPGNDSADLAQEVFLRLLCLREDYPIQQPRSFLFQVASNLAIDQLRMQRVRGDQVDIDELCNHLVSEMGNPEATVCAQQRLAILQKAIEELPPRCRTVFKMHRFEQHSHAEIAEELGVTVNMVEKHIIKAVAHCRRRLNERNCVSQYY